MLLLRRKQAIRCRLVAAYFGDTTLLSDSHTNRSRREWNGDFQDLAAEILR